MALASRLRGGRGALTGTLGAMLLAAPSCLPSPGAGGEPYADAAVQDGSVDATGMDSTSPADGATEIDGASGQDASPPRLDASADADADVGVDALD
jgi:hypothetical protein